MVVKCCGGCEIIYIGAPVHKGASSRVSVVMHRGQRADGSQRRRGLQVSPKGSLVNRQLITSTVVSYERSLFGTTRYHRNRVKSLSVGSKVICRKA